MESQPTTPSSATGNPGAAPVPRKRKRFFLASVSVAITVLLAEIVLHVVGFPYAPEILLRPLFVPAEDG